MTRTVAMTAKICKAPMMMPPFSNTITIGMRMIPVSQAARATEEVFFLVKDFADINYIIKCLGITTSNHICVCSFTFSILAQPISTSLGELCKDLLKFYCTL